MATTKPKQKLVTQKFQEYDSLDVAYICISLCKFVDEELRVRYHPDILLMLNIEKMEDFFPLRIHTDCSYPTAEYAALDTLEKMSDICVDFEDDTIMVFPLEGGSEIIEERISICELFGEEKDSEDE